MLWTPKTHPIWYITITSELWGVFCDCFGDWCNITVQLCILFAGSLAWQRNVHPRTGADGERTTSLWPDLHQIKVGFPTGFIFNTLWPSDAIWHCVTWLTLVQVMAWCLQAPSHYLNQCRIIISEVICLRAILQKKLKIYILVTWHGYEHYSFNNFQFNSSGYHRQPCTAEVTNRYSERWLTMVHCRTIPRETTSA